MGRVRYQVVDKNGQEVVEKIHKLVVHKIEMGDVEDPDLMVADPIWKWQQTPQGKFVMESAVDTPSWERYQNPMSWGHTYVIIAELEAKKITEYYLKFGQFIKEER